MRVTVSGTGFVGLSNTFLLAQHNEVTAIDIMQEKVDMINSKRSPIVVAEIQEFLEKRDLNLVATTDAKKAYENAEFVIISTPTNYDPDRNYFDTSSVENVIETVLDINKDAVMVIKSTIPVGYTLELRNKYEPLS